MKTLRITGVPEHFNYPFRLLFEKQPFLEKGLRIEWKEESRGSGQMNLDLRNNKTDLAIVLTESFLKDVEAGNPSKMIGFHVISPLIWGIHVGAKNPILSLSDVHEKKLLISRMGSGSHLMAHVLAKKEGWAVEELRFEVIDNMEGAEKAMREGSQGLFLWEKYTTAPMVDQGKMKRIGEIPSPWPCFVLVASDQALAEFGELIFEVRSWIYQINRHLQEKEKLAELLAAAYQLKVSEVEQWLKQTEWSKEAEIPMAQLSLTIEKMVELNLLRGSLPFEKFLVASLT